MMQMNIESITKCDVINLHIVQRILLHKVNIDLCIQLELNIHICILYMRICILCKVNNVKYT